ncbi:hypothetical protein SNOG_15230 [Parastagonospora nodorum SN15]|uniref:Uncharacterized protein n=1 Tax=Phaeosphaeria nodorum (strain SN15 / ATCC MYA-4574 / FGSC 10173) TaxID=321614 RepID=Q0TZA7_PHANO|nr:hypothetical protein SNOG_15230 [Parastagonospora nodorum SN15]EAT77455.1 hypothetical protein SNOG_15230 [Parastagonospora nodorum SN15]
MTNYITLPHKVAFSLEQRLTNVEAYMFTNAGPYASTKD